MKHEIIDLEKVSNHDVEIIDFSRARSVADAGGCGCGGSKSGRDRWEARRCEAGVVQRLPALAGSMSSRDAVGISTHGAPSADDLLLRGRGLPLVRRRAPPKEVLPVDLIHCVYGEGRPSRPPPVVPPTPSEGCDSYFMTFPHGWQVLLDSAWQAAEDDLPLPVDGIDPETGAAWEVLVYSSAENPEEYAHEMAVRRDRIWTRLIPRNMVAGAVEWKARIAGALFDSLSIEPPLRLVARHVFT